MPCGGIYPIKSISELEQHFRDGNKCWMCDEPTDVYDLVCVEWDCTLHYECLTSFLTTEEGRIVIEHEHEIVAFSRDDIKAQKVREQ
jgi:hypothetical protein